MNGSILNSGKSEKVKWDENFPGKKILRKMGFFKDQRGIINRYLREREGWESHLNNSRSFIMKCLEEARPESIIILGSGWLLDFPIENAYMICKNIELWDIYHPPQILRKIRDYSGVKPYNVDITGGLIREIYNFVRKYRSGNQAISLPDPGSFVMPVASGSYYVSLNVLTQLDILLVDYIRKFIKIPDKELVLFRKAIQSAHLGLLRKNACLISDVEEISENFNTEKQELKKLVYTSIPTGKYQQEWTWSFDSTGSYHKNRLTKMRVRAISF